MDNSLKQPAELDNLWEKLLRDNDTFLLRKFISMQCWTTISHIPADSELQRELYIIYISSPQLSK